MDRHEARLVAFLNGDLDSEASRAFDRHLLECEGCWSALQEDRAGRAAAMLLRQPAPADLADRVTLAVSLAGKPVQRRRRRRVVPALVAAVVLLATATAGYLLSPGTGRPRGGEDMRPIATVVQAADRLPATIPARRGGPTSAVLIGIPEIVHDGAATLTLSEYRVGDTELLAAVSDHDFPMPDEAQLIGHGSMPWLASRGPVTLYCPHAHLLIAGLAPAADILAAASYLPTN